MNYNFLDKYLKFFDIKIVNNLKINQVNRLFPYENEIKRFQELKNLKASGILDIDTIWELQFEYTISQKKLNFLKVKTSSLTPLKLREDVANDYGLIFNQIKYYKNFFLSNATLNLKKKLKPNISFLRYLGLVFFINKKLLSKKLESDNLFLVENNKNLDIYFNIEDTYDLKSIEILFYKENKLLKKKIARTVSNITNLFKNFNFYPIKNNFNDKNNFNEWYHFQNTSKLINNFSLFGIELLKSYELSKLEKSELWKFRKYVFIKDNFYERKDN